MKRRPAQRGESRIRLGWDRPRERRFEVTQVTQFGPLFRRKLVYLKEIVSWVNKSVHPNKTEITSFCLIEVRAPASIAAGVGEPGRTGTARPACQDKPCRSVSARLWLACVLGSSCCSEPSSSSPVTVLAPFPIPFHLFIQYSTDIHDWE